MRRLVPVLGLLLAAGASALDRHKLDIDAESADGILLQRIQQEPAPARRQTLLEKYVVEFPKEPGVVWVYEQLLPIYMEAKQYDRVLSAADGLLAMDSNDLDSAHYALKAAEIQKDPYLIRKYSVLCWDLAANAAQAKRPADPDDVADWTKQLEFAKQVQAYSEFVLGAQASAESDPAKKALLVQSLEKRNAQSKYLATAKSDPAHLPIIALSPEKAFEMADRGLLNDPDNEDYLLTVADHYLTVQREFPRVLACALRILEVMPRKSRPEKLSAAEWESKKTKYLAFANWMAGVVYGKQARYGLSDRHLRASLSYIHDDPRLLATAYFYLGYDNYAMAGELRDKGLAVEAVKFSKLCAAIDGPFQPLAQRNLEALRNDFHVE
jgi:hypothetical protein